MADNNTHGLDVIQSRLAAGDIDGVRKAILDLEPEGRKLLSEDLGEQSYQRVIRSARARRRARKKGRVIMLHGITGSMLDSVDRGGDADRIWVNPWALARGRIEELKLTPDGSSADPGHQIRTSGMHRKTYLPMILELDQGWHVHPFEYDWRHNIDVSADRLAQVVRDFRQDNEPVHLVAHSMGGLVSRCFIQRHPEIWDAMYDTDNPSAGGRLIMLGTPNYGAFSIVQMLTGQEKLLKILAFLDFDHDMKELLEILNTFQGSYQMLPSPLVDLGDDHKMLFDPDSWGVCPMITQHLADAKRFHADMSSVVDPERFIYVAGYNQKTAVKIKINDRKPGKFKFLMSRDGDGRVPHELGLLPNVPTFWIDEVHGDLPKNETVLAAIDELLVSGKSSQLAKDKPARRGAEADTEWVTAEEMYAVPSDIATRLQQAGEGERRGASGNLSLSDKIEIESLLADGFLASAEPASRASKDGKGKTAGRKEPKKTDSNKVPSISLEVVWGDITRENGDVYIVGHYQGVLPQYAELALDLAVSGQLGLSYEDLQKEEVIQRQVIRQHTRHGSVRYAVGEVTYFPWGECDDRERQVAVVGMGRPGSFGLPAMIRLIRDASLTISLLPCVKTICMVLIGSGEGNLRPEESVSGLVRGLAEALESGDMQNGIQHIKVVERNRNRSEEILQALQRQAEQPDIRNRIRLDVKNTLTKGLGGVIPTTDALEMVIDVASHAVSGKKNTALKNAIDTVLSGINTKKSRTAAVEALKAFREARTNDRDAQKKDYVVTEKDIGPVNGQVTRISCVEEGGVIRIAAITNTATMAERQISPSPDFVQDIVDQINDPDQEPMENLSSFLTRLFFPKDFRQLLSGADQFVFEVDRATAQIHWEMLAVNPNNGDAPLGVSACVARQLRTQYSVAPLSEHYRHGALKALVIGDPGSVKDQNDLPGAREEALAVREILLNSDVEVTALIGATDGSRDNIPSDVLPATRIAALNHLMHGDYDLLHYSGHGDFDTEAPDRVGWLFERGLLTAHEIRSIDNAPGLIVANACLSGRTSETLSDERQVRYARSEAGLLPSLADEFFRLGVWNYIGTSWEVNDLGAVLFAKEFYSHLLSGLSGPDRPTIGEAMLKARKKLYDNRDMYGKLWAAYQHYGDPAARVRRVGGEGISL